MAKMDANQVTISWSGGERQCEPGLIRLGRDPSNDIVIDNPHVSRFHGELRFGPSGWSYTDVGSAQGTFVDGVPVSTTGIEGSVALTLGRTSGERVEVSVATEARTLARSRTLGADVPDATVVVGAERQRPGGALRADEVQGATVVTGQTVNVECGGRNYTFSPGADVTIGRDLDCDIVSANPTVSRRHATLRYVGDSWTLVDAGSTGGVFVDGRRVGEVRLAGSTAAWLGDVETGERLVLVTGGARARTASERAVRAARKKTPLIVVGAVALVAVIVGVIALIRPSGSAAPDNNRLAKAAVRIDVDGKPMGSGTVIDAKRGLILTNAHVAAPRAPGQGVRYGDIETQLPADPRQIVVAVAAGLDKVAEPTYVAEVAAVDGYLDLAVLRITGTVGGAVIESDDLAGLTDVQIGESDDVRTGDKIRVFGFPAISTSNASTLTEGVVSGPVEDIRLSSNRAFLNLDAVIRGGNSGGLAADQSGHLVGVPTLTRLRGDETPVASMRPAGFAKPLVEAVRNGKNYTSPYVTPLSGSEKVGNVGTVNPLRAGFESTCTSGEASVAPGARQLGLAFDYEGFAAGQVQDVRVDVLRKSDGHLVGSVATDDQWPFKWADEGCGTATVPLTEPLAAGAYTIGVLAGPNYHVLTAVDFTVG
jgi:pSer/pThr/pTyr-binding forkhead associated (FHA) protein/S1-C subfamily serine protease